MSRKLLNKYPLNLVCFRNHRFHNFTSFLARFPFFTEMLWYLLDRYIHCLYGKTHLDLPEEEKRRLKLEKGENTDPTREFLKMAGLSSSSSSMDSSSMG